MIEKINVIRMREKMFSDKFKINFFIEGGQSKDGKHARPCQVASVMQNSELERFVIRVC